MLVFNVNYEFMSSVKYLRYFFYLLEHGQAKSSESFEAEENVSIFSTILK